MARIVDRPAKTGAILQAAARVFAERGYQAATMDAIADRAGIGKGTVYEYFRDKQGLFFAVFDDYIASMERVARQSIELPSATAAAQMQQAIHTILAMGAEARDLFPLVFEFWSASASANRRTRVARLFRDTYAEFRRLIAGLIRKGQQTGEFDRTADASRIAAVLVGALDGLYLQAWFDPALDPVLMGDDFVAVLLRGLAAAAKLGKKTPSRGRALREGAGRRHARQEAAGRAVALREVVGRKRARPEGVERGRARREAVARQVRRGGASREAIGGQRGRREAAGRGRAQAHAPREGVRRKGARPEVVKK